jgi:hypothetical protein
MARASLRRAQFDDAARYCALVKGGAAGLKA